MTTSDLTETSSIAHGSDNLAADADYMLNIVMAYEDPPARVWAMEVCDRVKRLVGTGCLRCVAWRISDLLNPLHFPDAVRAASRADVVVVSVRAVPELPIDLLVWIDAWLPRRVRNTGALVALLGLPEEAGAQACLARDYLQAVARKGFLDFLPQERKLPSVSSSLYYMGEIDERAHASSRVLDAILHADHGSKDRNWGIND